MSIFGICINSFREVNYSSAREAKAEIGASCKKNTHFTSLNNTSQKNIINAIYKKAKETQADHQTICNSIIFSKKKVVSVSSQKLSVKGILSMLLADPEWNSKGDAIGKDLLFATLHKKDTVFSKKARDWLQEKLNSSNEEELCPEMRAIYVRNLLSYYPFFNPGTGDEITAPLAVNGESICYTAQEIELTPDFLGSPLKAYGLIPKNNTNTPSLLLFKGTTYPTDDGAYLSVLTDLNPCSSIGGYAFHFFAKNKIQTFLETQRNGSEIMGASLGGSLSLQTAAHFPTHIKEVHAFNSPAVSTYDVDTWKTNTKTLEKKDHPKVNIYLQENDPVSSFVGSFFALDWKIHHVHSPITSIFQAHASAYTANKETFIIPGDPKSINESWKRRCWPLIQNVLLFPVFLVCLVLWPLAILVHMIFQACADRTKKNSST